MSPRHLIFALLIAGTLTACGDSSMSDFSSTSIANGAIVVRHGKVTLRAAGAPDAVISAEGNLKIDGTPVSTSAPQRDTLRQYYVAATAVREHGIAAGKAGVALAGESIKGALANVVSTDGGKVDDKAGAGSEKVNQEVMKICQDLADIKAAQDELASQLSAFKPYAGIINARTSEKCRKNDA
jgi:Protein of unknown function (DUF2884).